MTESAYSALGVGWFLFYGFISARTVWEHHWIQTAKPSGSQKAMESMCGASHFLQVTLNRLVELQLAPCPG